MQAEAGGARDEAKRLLADAARFHDDALSAKRSARARLEEAHDEAAQLVSDAADQASLVAQAADVASERLLADIHLETDEILEAAKAEDLRLRTMAAAGLEQARLSSESVLSRAAEVVESRRQQVTDELQQLADEASQRTTRIRAAAEESCRGAISQANAEAGAVRAASVLELAKARAEAEELRATTATEVISLRAEATVEADRVLGVAADHMRWTDDTVRSLLLAAEAEVTRSRLAGHAASATHLATRRRQLNDVIARVALRVRTAVAEATAEAQRLRSQANAILDAAQRDTIATHAHAQEHKERVVAEADQTVQAALGRSKRRLDDAESGARLLREHAAAEVARLQTDAHEHRRAVRHEATTTLAAARADADSSRTEARDLLTKARAEVQALADRRDDINEQLGKMSGVIEALAVPEHHAGETQLVLETRLKVPGVIGAVLHPENSLPPSPSLSANATTGT
ncbi:MAG: hypothetical protein QOE58_34 [Actinomycetota bacterium]|jgi:cell division septum initiation protein DivIVA|nr:hypothetical protein [Actinomycetota bacterium]